MNKVQIHLPNDILAPETTFKPRPPLHACWGKASTGRPRSKCKESNNIDSGTKCFTQVFDAAKLLGTKNEQSEENNSVKTRKKRVQSAKPRLISDDNSGRVDRELSVLNKKSKRPVSAFVESGCLNKPKSQRPFSAFTVGKTVRPFSASFTKNNTKLLDDSSDSTEVVDIEPCVFGYKSGAFLSGKNTEQESSKEKCKSVRKNSASSSVTRQSSTSSKTRVNNVRQLLEDDSISLTDLLDFEDGEDVSTHTVEVPETLQPLLPWQTPNVPKDVIGIDPELCLVFLPCLASHTGPLPCVPAPQTADQDLVYSRKIIPQPPPEKPKKNKKYEHPWTKLNIEEHICQHHLHRSYGNKTNEDEPPLSDRQIKIYGKNGSLIHESFCGKRTEEVVRKEIQELEDLMKGIGTENGCSLVVQYQADINRLQNMVDATLGRVEEIEMREAEKRRMLEPIDHFGLRQFYKDHDELVAQIKEQHEKCVTELSVLTGELNLHSARRHFNGRLASVDNTAEKKPV